MTAKKVSKEIIEKAEKWLTDRYDEETRAAVRNMIDNDPDELIESFYKDLEFGTGGLRGVMGAGTNRMNRYTVGMATQGLANYIKKVYPEEKELRVAISYDCRINSEYFARVTADVFSANGFRVFLFDELRPTPELSFAVRYLKCHTGVMITASHNPKEYNGYKAYWNDGAQMIPPHDKNVIAEVSKIRIEEVKFEGNPKNIRMIGSEVDEAYLAEVEKISVSPGSVRQQSSLKIVYTPLHGAGVRLVPEILTRMGFENIFKVYKQDEVNGNFPTVVSPNPEEPAAMEMAIQRGMKIDADLVMATDPDGDRVGVATKGLHDRCTLLNGNQTASLIFYYLLNMWQKKGKLAGNEYIVKTVVTSEIINDMAAHYKVKCYDVLTGFKWIADVIRKNEGKKTFIAGGEESYGYMIGDFVRDKDAVSSCAIIAELTAWAANNDKTLFDLLVDIYLQFGFYKERLVSVVKKGKAGAEDINKMMENFRSNPPKTINRSKVVKIKDYLTGKELNVKTGKTKNINLPKSNVLQFFTGDGTKVSMRPSGTEPKIKFYFSVKDKLKSKEDFDAVNEKLEKKIDAVIKSLGI